MATSAEIKSNNNTLIRLKTAPKSITKVVVADQLDAGIDYTAQEIALKQAILVSGTNIKTINGTSILGSGDFEVSGGGLPYKVYTAFLQFVDASTIVSTVIQNTIGNGSKDGVNDIAWSYNSATQPRAVMTSAPFLIDKCVYIPTMYFQSNTAYALRGARASDSEFRLFSSEIATSTASLPYISGVYVEIRVYN